MQFKDQNHSLTPPRATGPGWAHGTMVNAGSIWDFEVLEKLRKQKEQILQRICILPYFQDKGGDDDDAWPLQKMATRGRGKEVLEGTSNRTKRHKKQHLQMVVPIVARPLLQNFASRQGLYCCFKIYIRSWSTISAANCYSYSFQQMADSIALAIRCLLIMLRGEDF
ncbi:hypothetical protein OIU77_013108 [Salix suchowensis]|uniref:Uncharacterized protein n=1 Tax=Salix suchowensis TaxID=1278906 RepID=A0ABQ8ZTE8_9ROSI|nr:hypothetical protein OIU77_013108 [Salix suchowensis]